MNNMLAANVVRFLICLQGGGKIPYIATRKMTAKTSFSCSWEYRVRSFMLPGPKGLVNDVGLATQGHLCLHIRLTFFYSFFIQACIVAKDKRALDI